MLAAVGFLKASRRLFMILAGTADQFQMHICQGSAVSPTLFGLFFDGLHDHLQKVHRVFLCFSGRHSDQTEA